MKPKKVENLSLFSSFWVPGYFDDFSKDMIAISKSY